MTIHQNSNLGNAPNNTSTPDPKEPEGRLEKTAEQIRAKLSDTLDSLSERKDELFDLRLQVKKHPLPLALAAAGILLSVAGGVGIAVYRARERQNHMFRLRWKMMKRLWDHPEKIFG